MDVEMKGKMVESAAVDPARMLRCLTDPSAYPTGGDKVEVRETHISHIFFTGERVYKLKKPVRFPFLDYSSLEKRKHACEQEVTLNRRLAPDTYLGVLPVRQVAPDRFSLCEEGAIVDFVVAMKRLPAERMLDQLLASKAVSDHDRRQLLEHLVTFYQQAARGQELDCFATAEAVTEHVQGNLDALERFQSLPEHALGRIRSSQLQYLASHEELFATRIEERRICDGHGDLRPEHVCMTTPPVIYDCVEFSQEYRAGDIISEIAFLAMECDFLGAADWAQSLIREYQELAGDRCPESLGSFYKAYRACVRAKVEILRASQDAAGNPDCTSRALRYVQLASFYAAEFHQPMLWATVGISGSGKSVLGRSLSERFGATWLRTDSIRQELAGRRDPDALHNQGMYAPEMSDRTYCELLRQAGELLKDANSVVLDGTFVDVRYREQVRQLAKDVGAPVRFLYCDVPVELAKQRIRDRRTRADDISDASEELADLQKGQLTANGRDLLHADVRRLDMTAPIPTLVERVRSDLRHTQSD